MYTPPVAASEMAAWGVLETDFDKSLEWKAPKSGAGESVTFRYPGVWTMNRRIVDAFAALNGAWNAGPGGFTGIRPEAFREIRFSLGIGAGEWPDVYWGIGEMEDEVLTMFAEKREAERMKARMQ